MRLQYTRRFERAYIGLEANEALRVAKAIHLLAEEVKHPGLRGKKVQGTASIREARAIRSLRLTLEIHEDLLVLRNVGPHDNVLKSP